MTDVCTQYMPNTRFMREMVGIAEFAGLENDGVEQEETYILHTMK